MKAMKVQTPALDKKNGEQGVRTTIYKIRYTHSI